MFLSVPTNWDDELIYKIKELVNKHKDIEIEFYGKLNADFVGGGSFCFNS